MSYTGFGYDIILSTPLGKQKVSFDLDKVGRDIAAVAVDEAWPRLESRARQAWPSFVDQAIAKARPAVRSERDVTIRQASAELDKRMQQAKVVALITVLSLTAAAFGAAWYARTR